MGSAPAPGEVPQALTAVAEDYARAVQDDLGANLIAVVLYGSVARGEATVSSDIDLFVACEALPEGRFARLRLLDAAEGRAAVGLLLVEHAERLPRGFASHLDRLVAISRRLRQEREVSFSGNEEMAAPPEDLYVRDDAEAALRDAEFVLDLTEASFTR